VNNTSSEQTAKPLDMSHVARHHTRQIWTKNNILAYFYIANSSYWSVCLSNKFKLPWQKASHPHTKACDPCSIEFTNGGN